MPKLSGLAVRFCSGLMLSFPNVLYVLYFPSFHVLCMAVLLASLMGKALTVRVLNIHMHVFAIELSVLEVSSHVVKEMSPFMNHV